MTVLVCTILLLLLLQAPTTLEQGPGGKATITQGIAEAIHERMKSGGYNHIKPEVFDKLTAEFIPILPANITELEKGLARRFDEVRNYLLSEDLMLANSTHGVQLCCKNRLNLDDTLDNSLPIKVCRQESCVIRGDNQNHIGNWTIKRMPTDIRYLVTVTAVNTGETVIYPRVEVCHDNLVENRLESTDLIKTRPKDVVIVLDMSRIMNQSTFKDSNQRWMEAQGQMLNKILDILSERDRVIVVATRNGRNFTSHGEDGCHSKNSLQKIYDKFKEHFEMLERSGMTWDDSDSSDLIALIKQMEDVFKYFPRLQHKRAKIAVVFVASKNASEENNINTLIDNPFLERINLISICVGNIPGSNRPYTTDAVIKQHLKKYGSYLGVSSMDVVEGFADWFNQRILPFGTIISRTGIFPGIGPVLKMCYRREGNFVCLLVPVATIQRAVKWSSYIKSYWILLDEFCRVLIHPKSSYRGGQILNDLHLYEPELSINMSEPGCKITPENLQTREVSSRCKMIRGTNLTLCFIVGKKDFEMELYPRRLKDWSSNTPLSEGDCLYRDVIRSASPTVTTNSDSEYLQPATVVENRKLKDEMLTPKNNVKSLRILRDSIDNPEDALSTFMGLIEGVFVMDPGSIDTRPVDFKTKQWWKLARQNPNQAIVLPPYKTPFIERPIIWTNPTITVARAIMLKKSIHRHEVGEPSYHLLGVFGMVFDFYTFQAVFKQALSNTCSNGQKSCFIVDHDGYIVFHQKMDFHKEKQHITVKEPSVARSLYAKGILQKHYCTDPLDLEMVPIWKIRPPKHGSENFGQGGNRKTIFSVNQTNLYVIEVDRSETWPLECDCWSDQEISDLCSCPEQISVQSCKNIQETLPAICSPRHPDELKAIEIKPAHTTSIQRCPFLNCEAIDGERICEENHCHWCKVNHTGKLSHMCSEDENCIFASGFPTVPITHPFEKYIWIGIAVAGAIILLLCVNVVCHVRTYLKDKRKEQMDNQDPGSVSFIGYPALLEAAGLPDLQENPAEPVRAATVTTRGRSSMRGGSDYQSSHVGRSTIISADTGISEVYAIHDDISSTRFCEMCHGYGTRGGECANSGGHQHGSFHADSRHGMTGLDHPVSGVCEHTPPNAGNTLISTRI